MHFVPSYEPGLGRWVDQPVTQPTTVWVVVVVDVQTPGPQDAVVVGDGTTGEGTGDGSYVDAGPLPSTGGSASPGRGVTNPISTPNVELPAVGPVVRNTATLPTSTAPAATADAAVRLALLSTLAVGTRAGDTASSSVQAALAQAGRDAGAAALTAVAALAPGQHLAFSVTSGTGQTYGRQLFDGPGHEAGGTASSGSSADATRTTIRSEQGRTSTADAQDAPAASSALLNLPAAALAVLEGGTPVDLRAISRDVDAFFSRLAGLGENAGEERYAWARLLPWVAALSAVAVEVARRWARSTAALAPEGQEWLLGSTAFPPDEER